MNDREKLVELLDTAKIKQAFRSSTGTVVGLYHAKAVDSDFVKPLAELLIANGVTVQKHGRWEFVDDYTGRCTNCHEENIMDWECEDKFCPNCGAKMDA